jgi:hypothetical protein
LQKRATVEKKMHLGFFLLSILLHNCYYGHAELENAIDINQWNYLNSAKYWKISEKEERDKRNRKRKTLEKWRKHDFSYINSHEKEMIYNVNKCCTNSCDLP